jgi:putative ABC transport system permease protein
MIAGGYFAALGATVAGEACPAELPVSSTNRALVNRKFVETHAAGQNLIGRSLTVVQGGGPLTIAGIVDDIAEDGPGTTPGPYFYACYDPGGWPDPEYVVRTTRSGPLAADLRRIVADADSTRAIFALRKLDDVIALSFETPRFNAASMGAFAAAALSLAALGLYGLFALVVADRARDIAVRFALGATPRDVSTLVIGGASRVLVGGLSIGALLAFAVDRLLRHLVFDVRPFDPFALGAAIAVLGLVSVLAVALPARRAVRIDPIAALRGD